MIALLALPIILATVRASARSPVARAQLGFTRWAYGC